MAQRLLERSEELELLASAIDGVRAGSGRLVVVEGEAGIGKTALLAAARESASGAGVAVYAARGAELERDFGFGVVRQLFERRIEETAAFEGPAALAAPLLGVTLGAAPAGPEQATSAVMRGLYWLTANLARRGPLALIVDDRQWADAASLRFLDYLAGRLEGLPVLVLMAGTPGEAGAPGALMVRPAPLGAEASRRLVRDVLPDASEALCRECEAVTGGNPFFLHELAGTLRGTGAIEAADVLQRVPASVTGAIAARIGRLPGPHRELARATALLGGSGVMVRHAARLAGLSAEQASEGVDALVAAGIVLERLPLSFVHPIVRAAVYEEIPAGRRAAAHGRAARMLADDDAPPDRVAAHLLATEPAGDAWTCRRLAQAADHALALGAPEAAITALRRALEEPPAAPGRPALLIALGTAELLGRDTGPATVHLRRGIETTLDPDVRLGAAMHLAAGLTAASQVADAVELLDRTLEQAAGADRALVGDAEGQLINMARLQPDTRRRVAPRARRMRRRVDAGADVGWAELAAVATDMAMSGESAQRTAELALLAMERFRGTSPTHFSLYYPARALIGADRLDEAQQILDGLLAAARAGGDDFARVMPLSFRSELFLRRGELARAEQDARAVLELADGVWSVGVPAMAALLGAVLVEYGDLAEARALLDGAGIARPLDALPATYPVTMGLHLRGRLRLAAGDAAGAAEDLLECGRRLQDAGEHNPTYLDWRSCAAPALERIGEHDRARDLVGDELTLARRFGAPRATALALRARAALRGADALDDLRAAAGVLDGSPARLARAHVLGDLGAALLERGRATEAREPLSAAAELSQHCGSTALTATVLADLRRTGARPRRTARSGPDALTPAQRRVAQLAAQGLANRDIAARLVVTLRTVEFHLSGTYEKLGIRGRTELGFALAAPAVDQPPGAAGRSSRRPVLGTKNCEPVVVTDACRA